MQNNVTHITHSHAIVKTEKPINTKPHNSSNLPTPPILTSPSYNPNQNMYSQSQQSYFPYMFPPPPHYPYTVISIPVPTTNPHSPGDMKLWPKLNFPQSDRWIYSQFNFRPSFKDTKIQETTLSSGKNRQNYPFHDKMSLPHSPYPWYPASTSTEATCSETISVPETKLIKLDPVTINLPNKPETSTNEVQVDVIRIEPITANKDHNNPSSDAKKTGWTGFEFFRCEPRLFQII